MYLLRPLHLLLVCGLFGVLPQAALPYSVLTHEQLIDLAWNGTIQPLLKKRFPQTTTTDLRVAHAYAYGGCAIQDLGYYPFGDKFFSDLTHYVRSGDFVVRLLRDARNANEFAFALGALSHYVGDNIGHREAVNPSTAIGFPKLAKKYGAIVTYDEAPHAHIRVELAFDVDQLSQHRLAPGAYLRFIGLQVPVRLLAQAFEETYSIPLHDLLHAGRPTVRSYRSSVRSFLPRIAYAETVLHRHDFPPDVHDAEFQYFLDAIAHADFQTVWNQYRRNPGVETHLVAFLIRITPKIGVLSDLAIKIPTQDSQQLYIRSVNQSVEFYGSLLKQLGERPSISIPNRDLDTGETIKPGAYALTDKTYAKLLHQITHDGQRHVGPGLKHDVLAFYSNPNAPIATKKNKKAWEQVLKDLGTLRAMPGDGV